MTNPDRNLQQLRKAVLLQRLQKERRVHSVANAAEKILFADRGCPLPLSFAQYRLWFLDQLDDAAGAAYHMPFGLRLKGKLNKVVLRSALDRIIARHEVLRTSFVKTAGEPQQMIASQDKGFTLSEHDVSDTSELEQSSAIKLHCTDEIEQRFDMAIDPLIRGRLLRLAQTDHILLITQHHIISDGWSVGILKRELSALYSAFIQGLPDPLPPLPIQYADYSAWQRDRLDGSQKDKHLNFWKEQLEDSPQFLEVATDRARPAVQGYSGGSVELNLPAKLTADLRQLSQQHNATLFMTLLAAWSVLLSRVANQQDLVIGTPMANRQHGDLNSLIGFFVNTVALRVKLDKDPTIAELLAQVKQTTLAAHDHQDLPFEQVVEAVRPKRSLAYSPILQVVLALDNTGNDEASFPGIAVSDLNLRQGTTHFDLGMLLTDTGTDVTGYLEFASDLFDLSTIERLVGHFFVVLEAMVHDSSQHISRVPLLRAHERQQLLTEFNRTDVDFPRNQLIQQAFEISVQRHPTAIAMVHGDFNVTYDELNRRANRLAHVLIAHGVRPDDRVAICMERSPELIVGILGILKAGGAYVPLDPNSPVERLSQMLSDCEPKAFLLQRSLRQNLATLMAQVGATNVIELDQQGELDDTRFQEPRNCNPDPAELGLTSRNLAYVIYTSGSTGLAKGVMVEHRSVLRLVINSTYAPIGTDDCIAHCANPAFDASTWEIWGGLLNGARLLIVPQKTLLEPSALNAKLVAEKVSAMWLTSGLFNEYSVALSETFGSLRYLLIGGDVLNPRVVAEVLRRKQRPHHVVNGYGPTETTTFATTFAVDSSFQEARSIPIGKPIENTTVYILDQHLEPMPVGVVGEIFIGGDGVARGYLNDPDLTAERFKTDRFSPDNESRMYKSGDLGRWLTDGTIEYMGRNDYQIKMRGFRVELSEIESQLANRPGIREAVVIAREDKAGDKRLVAYLVVDHGVTVTASDLRKALNSSLADYMIPSAFVVLTELPLTRNGKLDRKALPLPDESAYATAEFEAPEGSTEKAVAAIWTKELGLDVIGRHDNFFELGGHSLLAVRTLERMSSKFMVNMDLSSIFASPSLSEFAKRIETTLWMLESSRIADSNNNDVFSEEGEL